MGIANDLTKAVKTLQQDGPGKLIGDTLLALRVRAQAPYERRLDEDLNVQTEGITLLSDLTINSPNKELGSEYVPSPRRLVEYAFSRLPRDLQRYSFVDFGSGKGRIVLHAAMQNFRDVIGVEFAQELYEISRENVATFSAANPYYSPINLILADAADLAIPTGNCVFFFYNPFRKRVMERVLGNIEASYRRHPRKMYFIHLALSDERGNDADVNRKLIGSQSFIRRYRRHLDLMDIWFALQFGSFRLDMFETSDPPRRPAVPEDGQYRQRKLPPSPAESEEREEPSVECPRYREHV